MAAPATQRKAREMTTRDVGTFTVEVKTKPQPGVTVGEIPPELEKLLAENAPGVVGSADRELVLTARDEAAAKDLAMYARAWGARQDPKLYIKKLPNGKQYTDNVARLSVNKWDDVPTENRAGRRAGK